MVGDLPDQWRLLAAQLRTVAAAESAATSLEYAAGELESAIADDLDRPLTLAEAARESGYSADHVGRLLRDGKIANVGRKGVPRVRRRDLPLRPLPPSLPGAEAPAGYLPDRLFRDIVDSKRGNDDSEE